MQTHLSSGAQCFKNSRLKILQMTNKMCLYFQSRLSEQHEYEVEKLLAEKEEALEEQATKFNKDMTDLRNTLLQQYEAQILEMTNKHEEAMAKAKQEFDTLVEKVKTEAREAAGM